MFHGNVPFPFLMELAAVIRCLGSEIVQIPEEVVAVILDAEAETVCLRDIDVALFVKGKRRGRLETLTLEIRLDLQRAVFRYRCAGQCFGRNETGDMGFRDLCRIGKFLVGIIGEKDVIDRDDTPVSLLLINCAQARLLPPELGDIEQPRLEEQAAFSRGLHRDLAIDDKLEGGFPCIVASGDEERDVVLHDRELRGNKGTDGFIAAVGGEREGLVRIVAELALHPIELAMNGREAEGGSGGLPITEAISLEGLKSSGGCVKGAYQEKGG